MTRDEVKELHYITHVDNVASIMLHGILPHNRAKGLPHKSVALEEVQQRRRKQVPNARLLHDYVNLYFNARNPMMFRVVRGGLATPGELVVFRVSPEVLDREGVVIADKNASSEYVLFHASPDGLGSLDCRLVFAEYWTDEDPFEQFRKKSAICAEALVPDVVRPELVIGAYVSCAASVAAVRAVAGCRTTLDIAANPHIFFL